MKDKLFNHFLNRLRSVNTQSDWASVWYKEMNINKNNRFAEAFLTSKHRPELVKLATRIANMSAFGGGNSFTFTV